MADEKSNSSTPRNPLLDAAEAEKFNAEAKQALAAAAESEANALKAQQEAKKLEAETRSALTYAEKAEMDMVNQRRDQAERMTADKFHHVYHFTEPVSQKTTRDCMEQLSKWRRLESEKAVEDRSPLEIVFSSPGGSVIDGMALYDFIQATRADGHKVITATIGYAASMAGILLQAGDTRVMGAESYLLIHEISFGAGGKIGEVEDEVAFVKKIQSRVLDIFAERSALAFTNGTSKEKLSKKQIEERWRRKDWWLDSAEALKLGFVDEVRGSVAFPRLPGSDKRND